MDSTNLPTQAVELVSAYLTTAVPRIPGSPAERLHRLVVAHMQRSPAGAAIFEELTNMPNDPGTRQVTAVKLAGLVDRDQQFALDLDRAVREACGTPESKPVDRNIAYNTIGGNVTGPVTQASSIGTVDQSQHTDKSRRTRINVGGLVLIVALVSGLGATAIVIVTHLVSNHSISGSGRPGPGTGTEAGSLPSSEGNHAAVITSPTQNQRSSSPGSDCGRAERPVLSLSPTRGTVDTKITVSGVGFIQNGRVNIIFSSEQMGEAATDCHGVFSVTLPIPQQEFFRNFPNQTFDVRATEYTSSGQYAGNGDFNGAQFHLVQ